MWDLLKLKKAVCLNMSAMPRLRFFGQKALPSFFHMQKNIHYSSTLAFN